MRKHGRRKCGRGIRAAIVVALPAIGALSAAGGDLEANARLTNAGERAFMVWAIRGAADLLGRADCQGLLDEFSDTGGQPLRSALQKAQTDDVQDYLALLLFYDAPEAACRSGGVLAGTRVGSRVVRVCGRKLAAAAADNARWVEAMVIHEMLHSLGLGENPPASDHITGRILARCRR